MSSSELETCKQKILCRNTEKSQLWALNVYQELIKSKNATVSSASKDEILYTIQDFYCEDATVVL